MRTGRGFQAVCRIAVAVAVAAAGAVYAAPGSGKSFTSLQSGYQQELVGVLPLSSSIFAGGVAFAPDGDPWVNECKSSGGPLYRFDMQSVLPAVNGTVLHPRTQVNSSAGCGMTNHPDGFLYSNTNSGVVKINADTGAPVGSSFGSPGGTLGIVPDPQTGDLVYVGPCTFMGLTCNILTVSPGGGAATIFVTVPGFVEEIAFNADGTKLYLVKRSPLPGLAEINRTAPGARTGVMNREIPLSNDPAGLALHPSGFLLVANTDGTLTKVVPGPPDVVTEFASGGGVSKMAGVGQDNCFYVTQVQFTRYDDDTPSSENSLVRICAAAAPPPPPKDPPPPPGGPLTAQVDIKPRSCRNPLPIRGWGLLKVAVLGTAGLDARKIAPRSIRLEGVEPIFWSWDDVSTASVPPAEHGRGGPACERGGDRRQDLVLVFDQQAIVRELRRPLREGQVRVLNLRGKLRDEFGGTALRGQDSVVLVND